MFSLSGQICESVLGPVTGYSRIRVEGGGIRTEDLPSECGIV